MAKFKIGDRVVYRDDPGKEGTIASAYVYKEEAWNVRFEGLPYEMACLPSELKLVNATPFDRSLRNYIRQELGT